MNQASEDLHLLTRFVSDLLSRVLMICGSLMAVANGLIPSLGAMIYGNLTDELVIRKNWNCTLNESVTTVTLKNLVTLEMIQPRMEGINITQTKSIEVTVNITRIQVIIVGMNGEQHNERTYENMTTVRMNGTALNGTELVALGVNGSRVEMVQLQNKTVGEKENDMKKDKRSIKGTGKYGNGGYLKTKSDKKEITREYDEARKTTVGAIYKRPVERFGRIFKERNVKTDFEDNEFFASSRKREGPALRSLFGNDPETQVINSKGAYQKGLVQSLDRNTRDVVFFTSEGKPKNNQTTQRQDENKVDAPEVLKVQPRNKVLQMTKADSHVSDDDIELGKAQSITSLFPPTPKPIILPPTNNISYTLINITKNCRIVENRVEENMSKYALYYVYAAIATLLFAYGQMVFWNVASERGVRNLSENLTDSLMDQDPGFYDTKIHEGVLNLEGVTEPREAISKKELDALSGGLGGEIAYMIQCVSNISSGFLVSFIENWKITMVMMAAVPVLGIVQGIAGKVEKFVMKQKDELMNRAKGMAKKSLGSVKTVVSYAGEKMEKTRYADKMEAASSLNKLKSLVLGIQKGLSTVLAFGVLGLGFWYSSTLLPGGSVTPGALMTIFMAIISGVMQMAATGEQVEDIGEARSALTSLIGISESDDDDPFDQAVSQLDTVFGKLDVFNVYFHYPSRPEYQLLKSISFTVDKGQTVALLGDKGCGKSALIKLLQRIYDPQIGKVRLDGQDIRFLDRRWFRRQVGIVHKNPEFFNTSIAENIAYGKGDATLKEVVRAAKDAGAHEFIVALPKGYANVLNEDGSPLTSYQKHLLALARAMIRNPRILLWEEDLSIMDNCALNVLTNYLNKARRGRTTVISTSHVSVARIADVIIVLHNGEIIDQGSPEELMLSGRAFRYLATLQYFESQSIHQEKLLKTASASAASPEFTDGIKTLESSLNETQEQTKDELKGIIAKTRQMIQDKLNEGQAAYKMIKMQLKDLPLLLAGALGASITGIIAPGLSFLFGEIQQFMNDPLRVAREGPFWAGMFVVLGAVVGFGGTIEKIMLSYATEKLRTRLQKVAFDTVVNKHSVPQIPGMTDGSSVFPGTGGQFSGIPQSSGIGLPAVTGISMEQLSTTGGIPSHGLYGMTAIPTGIPASQGLPVVAGVPRDILTSQGLSGITGIPTGIPASQGLLGITGIPAGTSSSQGFPGMTGTSTGLPASQGLPGLTEIPTEIPASQGLLGITGIPTAISSFQGLPGMTGISTGLPASQGLPGVTETPTGIPASQGLLGITGIPTEIPSSQGLPGITGIPTGIPSAQGISGITGIPTGIPSSQGLPGLTGIPTEIPSSQGLQGITGSPIGIPSSHGLPGITEMPTAIPASQGLPGMTGIPGGIPVSQGLSIITGIPTGVPASQGLLGITGVPTEIPSSQSLPGITAISMGIPSAQGFPGITGMPTGIPSSQGLPGLAGIPTGIPSSQGLQGITGIPMGIPSSQGLPGMTGIPAGVPTSQGLLGITGITAGIASSQGLPEITETPTEISASQGLPGITGIPSSIPPSQGLPGITGIPASIPPSQVLPGITVIPTAIPAPQGLPGTRGTPTGIPISQSLLGITGIPAGIPASQCLSGITELPMGIPASQGPSGITGMPAGIPGFQGLSGTPGIPTGIPPSQGLSGITEIPTGTPFSQALPGITGIPTGIPSSQALPGITGIPTGIPSSQGPPGHVEGDVGAMVLGSAGGSVGAMVPGAVGGGVGTLVPGFAGGGVGAMLPGSLGGGAGTMIPGSVGGGFGAMVAGTGLASSSILPSPGGLLPGSSVMPTGAQQDGNAMGVQQLHGTDLPPNMPNADLLALPDPQKQADELMKQVEKDVEAALQNSIGKYLGTRVQETISMVCTLGMALYNGWKMTLVVIAGLPIIGLATRIQQNEADATVEPEGVAALMKTSFKKMETISALGVENKFAKKYKDAIFEKYQHALKKIIASGFAFALGQAMVFFIYAGALRFGCYLITIGDMTPIQVLGVLMTVLFGSYATSSTRAPTHASQNTEESLNRLFDDNVTKVKNQMGDKLDEVEGSLDFKHVELADPLKKGTSLLSGLNMKVSGGQKLAIVPLDNEQLNPFELLMERFYDPARGALLLDGADIRRLDLAWLRSQHAVVSHRAFLPHYTIADNIAYGNEKRACAVTRREIEDAAYSTYAHEFIMELPRGYETVPDEDQVVLTDSQKLRIVIARAIIRGPPIIVMDELEDEDQAVNDATHILCRNRTCLILTRRRQTVEAADHIILMYRGRVLEQGTLDELRNQRRLYYLLTNLKDLDEI